MKSNKSLNLIRNHHRRKARAIRNFLADPEKEYSGHTTYINKRTLDYVLRACTYNDLSYVEVEMKKNSVNVLNNYLGKNDFFSFNKFLICKFAFL